MLYSCAHMATVRVKGLRFSEILQFTTCVIIIERQKNEIRTLDLYWLHFLETLPSKVVSRLGKTDQNQLRADLQSDLQMTFKGPSPSGRTLSCVVQTVICKNVAQTSVDQCVRILMISELERHFG